ncbi:hypothetical protein FB451DRAFT_1516702 [Mycena latifolia]|nr:hypothetical protein FB451DRAFT_1516702 [Mycena latifolia]
MKGATAALNAEDKDRIAPKFGQVWTKRSPPINIIVMINMIRLGLVFRRLLHAVVSKYEYPQRYISAPASLHHRASKVPATPTPATSTPADAMPSPRRPTPLPPHIEALSRAVVAGGAVVPLASATAYTRAHATREQAEPDRAVVARVLIVVPQAVHILVSARAVSNAARGRAHAGLDLVELRLRERARVMLGVDSSSSGAGVEAEDEDAAAADARLHSSSAHTASRSLVGPKFRGGEAHDDRVCTQARMKIPIFICFTNLLQP